MPPPSTWFTHGRARSDRGRAPRSARIPTTTCSCSVSRVDHRHGARRVRHRPRAAGGRAPSPVGNARRDQLEQSFVREVARRREHHVRRLVVRAVIGGDVVARHRGDRVGATEHFTAERMLGEHRLANRSCTRSSGVSSRIPISSRMTRRSDSTSSPRNAGDHSTSASTSNARSSAHRGRARRTPSARGS